MTLNTVDWGLKTTSTASLQKSKTPAPNVYPGYDIKPSDDKAPLICLHTVK